MAQRRRRKGTSSLGTTRLFWCRLIAASATLSVAWAYASLLRRTIANMARFQDAESTAGAASAGSNPVLSGKPPSPAEGHSRKGPGRLANSTVSTSARPPPPPPASGRFPLFGTAEFQRECGWTLQVAPPKNCTILSRPKPNWTEGFSAWSVGVVSAYLWSRQIGGGGCRFLLDYGADNDVDVKAAFLPQESDLGAESDWRVPRDYECAEPQNCFVMYGNSPLSVSAATAAGVPPRERNFVPVLMYRRNGRSHVSVSRLEAALPGFHARTGMACAFGRLFRLSHFVPDVHSKILPALRDRYTLVLAVYLRTGRMEIVGVGNDGTDGRIAIGATMTAVDRKNVECAETLEAAQLKGAQEQGAPYRRSAWMLVTDSPAVREEVVQLKHGIAVPPSAPQEERIRREVLFTSSRGAHTRTSNRDPGSADFAEAAADWYLMGESDLVIGGNSLYTFGKTAALRTARKYYDGLQGCVEVELVS